MPRRNKRFTIYDMMEEKGVFEANPANPDSRDVNGMSIYKKAEFPLMLYHPDGARRVMVPGEIIATPMGPRKVGEQTALINKTVNSEAELEAALAEGWHRSPHDALRAANGEAPLKSQEDTIRELEEKIASLQLAKNEATDKALAEAQTAGAIVSTKPKAATVAK